MVSAFSFTRIKFIVRLLSSCWSNVFLVEFYRRAFPDWCNCTSGTGQFLLEASLAHSVSFLLLFPVWRKGHEVSFIFRRPYPFFYHSLFITCPDGSNFDPDAPSVMSVPSVLPVRTVFWIQPHVQRLPPSSSTTLNFAIRIQFPALASQHSSLPLFSRFLPQSTLTTKGAPFFVVLMSVLLQ